MVLLLSLIDWIDNRTGHPANPVMIPFVFFSLAAKLKPGIKALAWLSPITINEISDFLFPTSQYHFLEFFKCEPSNPKQWLLLDIEKVWVIFSGNFF